MNAFSMDVRANSTGDVKLKLLIAFQLPDDWKMDVNISQWCRATTVKCQFIWLGHSSVV